ncbi:LysR family transcriptional regulator [Jatrophihabitans fulvus]
MDFRQLEVVREVVGTGSVTAAAQVLHCTPSAVSQQLRAAERSAGTALVEKDGRGLRPTPAGRALAAAAGDVAVAVERARSVCDEYVSRPTGTVRVSAFQSAGELFFPPVLARIAAEHEGITVECAEYDVAQDEFPAVTAHADIVIGHRPRRSAPWQVEGVGVTTLLHEPLDVALPVGHPLAARDELTPADLADERWITVQDGFPIVNVLRELEGRAGRPFDVRHRINDFHVTEAMVAAGHGLALVPRYAADDRDGSRFVLRPVRGLRAGRTVEALYRHDRAQRRIVRTVLRVLRAEAAAVTR